MITARKLPAILAFLDFIEDQRAGALLRRLGGSSSDAPTPGSPPRSCPCSPTRSSPTRARTLVAEAAPLYLPPEARAMNSAPAPRLENSVRNDVPCLATAPLRPGFDRRDLSRYGDASWDLGPAVFRENARRCHVTVHFDADPGCGGRTRAAGVSLCATQRRSPWLSAALAARQHSASFQPRAPLLGVCSDRTRAPAISRRVDQSLLDRLCQITTGRAASPPIVCAQLLEVVFDLHAYRAHLPTAGLQIRAMAGSVALPRRGLSLHRRREPHATHARRRDRAAAGVVAQIRHPVRTGYPRHSRRTHPARGAANSPCR